jgi:hypothetical protein
MDIEKETFQICIKFWGPDMEKLTQDQCLKCQTPNEYKSDPKLVYGVPSEEQH